MDDVNGHFRTPEQVGRARRSEAKIRRRCGLLRKHGITFFRVPTETVVLDSMLHKRSKCSESNDEMCV